MNTQIKKILSSKIFWVILGLGVLLWLVQRYTFWNLDMFLAVKGPHIVPLTIPMIIFYKGVTKNRYLLYFMITSMSLVLWVIWSLFWFAIVIKSFGGGFKLQNYLNYFIYPIITLSLFLVAYTFLCYHLISLRKLAVTAKRAIMWFGWFVELVVIMAIMWWYFYAEIKISDYCDPDPLRSYISASVEFFLMWLIFTLPATLKIDNILSKENKL